MVEQNNRNYSVTEVRDIISLACTVSNLSSERIMGMVCLADLLKHINGTRNAPVEEQVRAFFEDGRPHPVVAFDDIDD